MAKIYRKDKKGWGWTLANHGVEVLYGKLNSGVRVQVDGMIDQICRDAKDGDAYGQLVHSMITIEYTLITREKLVNVNRISFA